MSSSIGVSREELQGVLYCNVHPGHTEQDEESVRRNELRAASFDEKQSMNQETGGHFDSKWSQRGQSEAVHAR